MEKSGPVKVRFTQIDGQSVAANTSGDFVYYAFGPTQQAAEESLARNPNVISRSTLVSHPDTDLFKFLLEAVIYTSKGMIVYG